MVVVAERGAQGPVAAVAAEIVDDPSDSPQPAAGVTNRVLALVLTGGHGEPTERTGADDTTVNAMRKPWVGSGCSLPAFPATRRWARCTLTAL